MKSIVKLIEPRTLVAGAIPVIYATLYGKWYTGNSIGSDWILVLLVVILMQASANMINDYFDFSRGSDSQNQIEEKVLVSGELTKKQVVLLILIFEIIAFSIGAILILKYGWILFVIGLLGLLISISYAGGPKPISYTPFGELIAGITMGIGITCTVLYMYVGNLSQTLIIISLPLTIYISQILLTNNICDIKSDKVAGRKTLPIIIGYRNANILWAVGAGSIFLVFLGLFVSGLLPKLAFAGLIILSPIVIKLSIKFLRIKKTEQTKSHAMAIVGKTGVFSFLGIVVGLLIELL